MAYVTQFLAGRYLLGTQKQKSISIMLGICFTGIFIGSFSLALILSIMNGFEKVTHEKLQGIHAQAIMRSYGQDLNMPEISAIIEREFPEIIGYSPTVIKQSIIQSETSTDKPLVVFLKGINPLQEHKATAIETKITSANNGSASLDTLVKDDQIVMGKKLAEELDVIPGDTVTLLFAPDDQTHKKKISFHEQTAVISGTFDTGIEDFDRSLVLCSFELIDTMWPESNATQISIKFAPTANETATVQKLRDRFNMEVYSWKDLYPALVSALKLEKYAMFFILALITLVASMNIISLQFMHITQKRGDIAILKSLGMKDESIVSIFVTTGMIITVLGSLAGLACAALVGFILSRYPFITLPDAYYVTHLPIYMEWHLFALVFVVVLFLGLCATWFPARRTRAINIAQVLRFDA